MKKNQYILFFIVLFLCVLSLNCCAQELTNENTYIINQYFQLSNTASSTEANINSLVNQSQINVVSLNQIGNENQIEIKGSNSNSQIVNQEGQDNYYEFINYYNNNPSNFNILQQGNSNSLQIYGQNSIIEKLSVVQKSNAKSITITNY